MGINQIAAIGGSLAGLLIGGVLATFDWHLVFLVSVPVGIVGTIWAYIALKEIATIKKGQKIDVLGNITFAVSLTLLLISLTYGLLPYENSTMGWTNPMVISGVAASIVLMLLFIFIETKVKDPMFHLQLFRLRAFAASVSSMFLSGMARGGLQFMLVIWLQGIWLPLHGVSFINTPLQAAIDMIPLVLGFVVFGPISGHLSDKYGSRAFTVAGMLINAAGFIALASLPANFSFVPFAVIIFIIGAGQGLFAAPNTTAAMNAVPPETRGAASGMRATFMNVSFMLSLIIFFTLLIVGTAAGLQKAMYTGLISENVSAPIALNISQLPPTAALFASFLGYNPLQTLIPQNVFDSLPANNKQTLLGTSFFPNLISKPFMDGMQIVLYVGAVLSFLAATIAAMVGPKYVHVERKK